ncbi:ABC-type methionine transport system ATPase subunit [Frondihabitans sp. PhB188]|uniref:methionine ABC transporter ATP-binding protein n=1 Tax=Frondihabitans sp. PhB188 TaxID=2485200 RepID=UPI000F49E600|nr:ATP-binding cassette domain-containing protein [Frondihabitans sp. PhB188]ROQ41088.1 ABC-type methionine transport system ATPase subunit [Frondihabitans sp. PhB188]
MIRIDQLTKAYEHAGSRTVVLDSLDFEVGRGEIAAVVGRSGAGKSTLAQCVTLLELPTSGSVIVDGVDLTASSERDLRTARRAIGTIFQSDGLFSRRTAAENVALPLEFLGVTPAESRARVAELLERVGLGDKARHYPHQLSGGQRQRVGVARALALRPRVLLSDEATSGLDPESTQSILGLLRELRDDLDLSILLITHEMEAVREIADTVARLEAGRFTERGRVVDLLQDQSSQLGADLQPQRASAAAADGQVALLATYGSPDVPADWLARVSAELGEPVGLLGAAVEVVDGTTVGTVTVGVPASHADAARDALARLGIQTRRDADPLPLLNDDEIETAA